MEEKRNKLAVKLHDIIEGLYEEFKDAGDRGDVEAMLKISDRITCAAEVLANLYGIVGLEAQIEMLEKALQEADA